MTSKRRETNSRKEQSGAPLPTVTADAKRRWQPFLFPLLALLPLATFWPVLRNGFIAFDDDSYVSNGTVRNGLTWAGVRWAFTTGYEANWHPLTWLSHMADVSLYGRNPAGHHATSLVLHVVNTLLLFVVFRDLTKDSVRSAWVAALFAVHPAHVESVAWVAERKDVLSTAFWLATMWAYGSWVRKGGAGRYAVVLLFFAAGLMAKPMLVSLPLVLLLIDYWPLKRLSGAGEQRRRFAALILEKAPLFLLAAASSVVTFLVQRAGGAVGTLEKFPLWARAGNALVAYVRYLKMLFWPVDLAVLYPHPGTSISGGEVLAAGILLVALSVSVVALRRRAPYLFVGWFWFLVTLLPVIGLVQVGAQAMADRYTYVPFIGLFVAIAWGVPALTRRWRYGRVAVRAAAVAVLLVSAAAAAAQVRLWKNTETLFVHTLKTTKNNFVVENNLGDDYNNIGRPADALPHITEALRLRPNSFEADINMGRSLLLLGRLEDAASHFARAIRLDPHNSVALNNLARARFLQGDVAEAIPLYEAAVAAAPAWPEPRRRLAVALLMEGKTATALFQLERAITLDPSGETWRQLLEGVRARERNPNDPAVVQLRRYLAAAHRDASVALHRRGKRDETRIELWKTLELLPESAPVHNDLGTLLVEEGRLEEAGAEFREALRIDPRSALAHNNLGYVFFRTGRREAAIEEYREALRLQPEFPLARNNLEEALR